MTNTHPTPLLRTANILVAVLIAAVPFHAFLTTWGASIAGHYTLLRLWEEIILVGLMVIVGYWLVREKSLRVQLFKSVLFRLIVAYALLTILLGIVALLKEQVTLKALGYGWIVNLRYISFFLVTLVVALRSEWLQTKYVRLLLWPAIFVGAFALLQYTVLPHNFLSHFGYNAQTIVPIETINDNPNYIRVQSTLRGANPLGAYMVVILAAVVALWPTHRKQRQWLAGVGLLAGEALLFSFSRSAWLGAVLAVGVVVWLSIRTKKARLVAGSIAAGVVLMGIVGFLTLRNQAAVQNALYHTDEHSKVALSSNEARAAALKDGLSDVVHEPFGRGPGTAGPASAYNGSHGARIAENYFIQIAQEVGWLGLALLLTIFSLIMYDLVLKIRTSPLALLLFASFLGLTIVNLLSHAWVDDTLAFTWWGLAGVALAIPLKKADPQKSTR